MTIVKLFHKCFRVVFEEVIFQHNSFLLSILVMNAGVRDTIA